jgi:hypothetical protein
MNDHVRRSGPALVFTGDTLSIGAVGRPDLSPSDLTWKNKAPAPVSGEGLHARRRGHRGLRRDGRRSLRKEKKSAARITVEGKGVEVHRHRDRAFEDGNTGGDWIRLDPLLPS